MIQESAEELWIAKRARPTILQERLRAAIERRALRSPSNGSRPIRLETCVVGRGRPGQIPGSTASGPVGPAPRSPAAKQAHRLPAGQILERSYRKARTDERESSAFGVGAAFFALTMAWFLIDR